MNMKTQRPDGTDDTQQRIAELVQWVSGLCCEGRHDHWKAELLQQMVNEHSALVAVAEAAKRSVNRIDAAHFDTDRKYAIRDDLKQALAALALVRKEKQ